MCVQYIYQLMCLSLTVDVAKTTVWIVMKIKWFSLIHVILNCSVWSAVAATYTRNGQA